MTIPSKELERFKGYRFTLREYKQSHSTLVLSAINPEDLSSRFELGFSEVHYIRMPLSWIGNIEEGSIFERDEILKTDTEESVELIRRVESGLKLYKANQNKIIIIGYLLHIGPWE
jgi:hypothetical protein